MIGNYQLLQRLTEYVDQKRLVVFLGADLPAALTGLPSRKDLAAGLAQRYGMNPGLSLSAVAQRVASNSNRFNFTDYLSRQLETTGLQPNAIHRLIVQLPLKTIITTTYDNLLELAYRQANLPLNRLVRDSDLAFADPRYHTVIKLYGDVQQRETLVVTEDDHNTLWHDRQGILNRVRDIMSSHAILFIGYNLGDPDFNILWRQVVEQMGEFAIGAFAVAPEIADDETQIWQSRKLQIIDTEPLPFMEQFVAATMHRQAQLTNEVPLETPPAAQEIKQAPAPTTPRVTSTKKGLPDLRVRIELIIRDSKQIEVRALKTPGQGEPHALVQWPFDDRRITAVGKLLATLNDPTVTLTEAQRLDLVGLNIPTDSIGKQNVPLAIGQLLYGLLFTDSVGEAIRAALNHTRTLRATLPIELCFDEHQVDLARLPWELLHNGRRFLLASNSATISRYITYPEAPAVYTLREIPRVLVVTARPRDLGRLPALSDTEQIRAALGESAALYTLVQPTYDRLLDGLNSFRPDIVHFDGHGSVFRRCPVCSTRHYPQSSVCVSCSAPLQHVRPQGYLAFEHEDSKVDWIDCDTLGHVLYSSSVQIAVLLACSTGIARGVSLFNGVAQALIGAGIPYVIATQAAISSEAAICFTNKLYSSLAQDHDVVVAVQQGRRSLFRGPEWYMPVLYVRC